MGADATIALDDADVAAVARSLLGRVIVSELGGARVALRLTEVEAYGGVGEDPASHAFRGLTRRSAVMAGPADRLYTYFTYGMHWCANVVTGPEGRAAAVLLRAGQLLDGEELARRRRGPGGPAQALASGPARLARCLGIESDLTGLDLCEATSVLRLGGSTDGPVVPGRLAVSQGPRVGVRDMRPWRFWVSGDPTVSQYRSHRAAKASGRLSSG